MSVALIEPGLEPDEALLTRSYDDGKSHFTVELDQNYDTTVIVGGHGTIAGAKALLAMLDEVIAVLGPDRSSRVYVDLADNTGGPFRGQLWFGKWLLKHRRFIARGVIVGAPPTDRLLATGAIRIARLKNVRFFKEEADARAWLAEV